MGLPLLGTAQQRKALGVCVPPACALGSAGNPQQHKHAPRMQMGGGGGHGASGVQVGWHGLLGSLEHRWWVHRPPGSPEHLWGGTVPLGPPPSCAQQQEPPFPRMYPWTTESPRPIWAGACHHIRLATRWPWLSIATAQKWDQAMAQPSWIWDTLQSRGARGRVRSDVVDRGRGMSGGTRSWW